MALTYEGLWEPSYAGVMAPRTKGTSRPGKAKTVCCSWLWHKGASCWPETRRTGLAAAAARARAALAALKRTRALHELATASYGGGGLTCYYYCCYYCCCCCGYCGFVRWSEVTGPWEDRIKEGRRGREDSRGCGAVGERGRSRKGGRSQVFIPDGLYNASAELVI